MVFLTEFFEFLVIANVFTFVAMLATSGRLKKFFVKIWGTVFILGIIVTMVLVKNGVFQ